MWNIWFNAEDTYNDSFKDTIEDTAYLSNQGASKKTQRSLQDVILLMITISVDIQNVS